MSIQTWTYLIVGFTFAVYIGIAIFSRVRSTAEFYVAGRGVPASLYLARARSGIRGVSQGGDETAAPWGAHHVTRRR